MAESEFGIVRAMQDATAREVASQLDEVTPLVRARVPGLSDSPVEVWVSSRVCGEGPTWQGGIAAWTDGPRIHLLDGAPVARGRVLAHELVHALADRAWTSMPHAIEEGLADWAAGALSPDHLTRERTDRGMALAGALGGEAIEVRLAGNGPLVLSFGLATAEQPLADDTPGPLALLRLDERALRPTLPDDGYARAVALGLAIVCRSEHAGRVETLRAMALAADAAGVRVEPEALLELAKLPPGAAAWPAVLEALVGRPELERIVRDLVQPDAGRVARLIVAWRPDLRAHSGADALLEAGLTLRMPPASTALRLTDHPGFVESFKLAWSQLPVDDSPEAPVPSRSVLTPSSPAGASTPSR